MRTPTPNQYPVANGDALAGFLKMAADLYIPKCGLLFQWGRIKNYRTLQQNRAMHLYFEHLAMTLNDAGLDMRKVLKPSIEIPWTKASTKSQLWVPIQMALTEKEHTSDLETDEVDKVYSVLNRNMSEKFGVYVPFPDRFGR